MSNTVYMLWFEYGGEDNDDSKFFIGVYSSESQAKAAIERVKGEKGFADFPDGESGDGRDVSNHSALFIAVGLCPPQTAAGPALPAEPAK